MNNISEGWFVEDKFYYDLDIMAEDYAQDILLDKYLDFLPNKAYIANRKYLKLLPASKVIARIIKYPNQDFSNYAQEIWETAVNDLWLNCDDEFTFEPNSINELHNAINNFALSLCKKKDLEKALLDFEEDNKHFWVYTPSTNFLTLDADFWKP